MRSLSTLFEASFFLRADRRAARKILERAPAGARSHHRLVYARWFLALAEQRWDEAIQELASVPDTVLQDRCFRGPKALLGGIAHLKAGRVAPAATQLREAERILRELLAGDADDEDLRLALALTLAYQGRADDARSELAAVEPLLRGRRPYLYSGHAREMIAETYAVLGDVAGALPWLRLLLSEPSAVPYTPASFRLDVRFDRIGQDPRVQGLLAGAAAGGGAAPAPVANEKSVAVLAFESRSGEKTDENLAQGIADDLIMVLGRVPGLQVAARTSAFHFRGKSLPVREIARELGVAYVVEGSVQREGARVKVNVSLIKAEDGFQAWRDQLVQELRDVLALQERIAAQIAQHLSLQLGAAGRSREQVDPRAFERYAEARVAWGTRTREGFDRAERALLEAVSLAPRYAAAHAALVDVGNLRGQASDRISAWGMRSGPEFARLMAKCDEALALDPQSAEAKTSRGGLCWVGWRFAESERVLREATQLNPNFAPAHQWLGRTLVALGHMDEALLSLATAVRLDPLAPRILDNHAWALILAGRLQEASVVLDRALALQPEADQAAGLKALVLAMNGERSAAVARARAIPNGASLTAWLRVQALALAGERTEAEGSIADYRDGNLIAKLCGLAALGRFEEALQSLDVDWLVSTRIDWLLYHPIFDPIRGDPRFQTALSTVGLTEAHARAQAWRAANPPEKMEVKR